MRPDSEQKRTDRRADDNAQALHRVQQPVSCAEPHLPNQPRQQRDRRGPLRRPRRRHQRGQHDHDLDGAVGGDDRAERKHQREPQQVTADQHGPPAIAVGDQPADPPDQHVGKQTEDRRGADPPDRAGREVHVAQQRGVKEPVADL